MDEFSLIDTYFRSQRTRRDDVVLGIGDDAAVLSPGVDRELVITTDLVVADVHFSADTDPGAVGHKALAVNLSDLAAMGAEPAWATLTLCIPRLDTDWLKRFSRGMFALMDQWSVQLVGGDTVRGPLSIGIQVCGFVERGGAIRRAGARPGDDVYVTGTLGDAAAALEAIQDRITLAPEAQRRLQRRLDFPTPRVREGWALRGIASAAIDVSDGLAADLAHLTRASGVAAQVDLQDLPLSAECSELTRRGLGWDLIVGGGDDYELCFTAPAGADQHITSVFQALDTSVTRIGRIAAGRGVTFQDGEGREFDPRARGYDHFRADE